MDVRIGSPDHHCHAIPDVAPGYIDGIARPAGRHQSRSGDLAQLTAQLPPRSWQRLSAGAGAHGPRLYSWAWIPLPATTGNRWILVRRNDSTREHALA